MGLTNTAIKRAKAKKKQYRLTDSQGMYLLIKPSGKKYWRLDYSIHGTRKTYAIGTYPEISLKEARVKRAEAKSLIADGIDPVQHRQVHKQKRRAAAANTFEAVGREWFTRQADTWKPRHASTVLGRLEKNIFPWLGNTEIESVTAPIILSVLRRIEARGAVETAHRCKTICSQIMRYAVATGRAERDPCGDLRGALTPTQPKHMATITDPQEVGALLRAIDGYQGHFITRCALKLAPLVFVRPGDLRQMRWKAVNWIKKEWLFIPEKRRKKIEKPRPLLVPLSRQALEILREIYPLTGHGEFVFPSPRTDTRPMSNNGILSALRRMGYAKEEMTGHGFRAMASTLLHELNYSHAAIELQLDHVQGNKVSLAYNHAEYLPERTKMMQGWADYLDELRLNKQEPSQVPVMLNCA